MNTVILTTITINTTTIIFNIITTFQNLKVSSGAACNILILRVARLFAIC
jgi:hypothetical protein